MSEFPLKLTVYAHDLLCKRPNVGITLCDKFMTWTSFNLKIPPSFSQDNWVVIQENIDSTLWCLCASVDDQNLKHQSWKSVSAEFIISLAFCLIIKKYIFLTLFIMIQGKPDSKLNRICGIEVPHVHSVVWKYWNYQACSLNLNLHIALFISGCHSG